MALKDLHYVMQAHEGPKRSKQTHEVHLQICPGQAWTAGTVTEGFQVEPVL